MFPDLVAMRGLVIQDDIFTSDIHNFHFPNRAYYAASLKDGVIPLWTPNTYGGFPFFAHIESGSCYPPNVILYTLLPLTWAQNLSVLLPFVIAAAGLFLLAREIGSNRVGAFLGALAFAYSGFFISHVKHMDMVQAAAWVPWLFWLIERGVSRNRFGYFVLFAVLYTNQIFAGFPHISYYSALTCSVFFAFRLLRERAASTNEVIPWIRRVWSAPLWIARQPIAWCFAAAGVLGAGMAAVQLVPSFELAGLSPRGAGADLAFATNYAYHIPDALTFLVPFINGDPGVQTYSGTIFWENYAYLGVIPFLLAVYAAVSGFRSVWHVRFFIVFAVVCFSLVLGKWSPTFYAAYFGIPGFSFFRFPTRFLLFVDLSIALLAAWGWTRLSARLPMQNSRTIAAVGSVLVVVTFADLWFVQRRHVPIAPASTWLAAPPAARYMQSQPPERFRMYSVRSTDTHRAAYEMAGGWQGDLTPYDLQRAFVQPNTNALYGIESVDGYMSLVPEYVASVWGDAIHSSGIVNQTVGVTTDGRFVVTPSFIRIASAFNVKYVVTPSPVDHPSLVRIPVEGDAFLYENRSVLPRAYVVNEARVVSSDQDALDVMASDAFRPLDEVLLFERDALNTEGERIGDSGAMTGAAGLALIESYGAHRVDIRVSMRRSGYLVLADTYYPGWQAKLDGRPVQVLRANVSQRAVYVSEGDHRIVFEFHSRAIGRGLAITSSSILLVVVMSLVILLRRRANQKRT
jgi:hypothetical protein